MLSNRCTLAALDEMDESDAATLPIDQLMMLLEDVAVAKATAKRLDDKLHAALDRRFSEAAHNARHDEAKDTGRVRWDDGDYIVVSDLPRIVDWDQNKLREAEATIRSWGEPVEDYMTVKLSVPETKYKALPMTLRSLFEPARTVRTGKPSYTIERKKEEAA